MPVVIEIGHIDEIQAKIKGGKVSMSFETNLKPADVARLVNLSRQGAPMQAIISSPQASMDLRFEEVDTRTGELKSKDYKPDTMD